MNTFKQMGIQQWQLKKSYAQTLLNSSESASENSLESDSKSESEFNAHDQRNPELKPEGDLVAEAKRETTAHQESDQSQSSDNKNQVDQNYQELLSKPVDALAESIAIQKTVTADPSPASDSALSKLDWQGLQMKIDTNDYCPSCGVGNTLLGSGNANAQWMFVIDAPTSREVTEQSLFVGRAGELFDAMLSALGLSRSDVYSSSIFKCAPTADLSATPQCNELVHRQIELIAPSAIVTFGEFSGQAVLKANEGLGSLRASDQRCIRTGIAVVPTYSPVEMLNDPSLKALVWQDLKKALAIVA